jgi:hypothetical protein
MSKYMSLCCYSNDHLHRTYLDSCLNNFFYVLPQLAFDRHISKSDFFDNLISFQLSIHLINDYLGFDT